MPITTLRPFNDALIQATARRSAQYLGRALRPRRAPASRGCGGSSARRADHDIRARARRSVHQERNRSSAARGNSVSTGGRRAPHIRVRAGLAPAVRAADALPFHFFFFIAIACAHIQIFDDRSVREPLIGLNVDVHCGTAPHFVRSYQLFVDPPTQIPAMRSNGTEVAVARDLFAIDAAAPVATRSEPTASAPITRALRDSSPRARGQAGGDLTQGQTYRVVRGDALSGIAARVAERPATISETRGCDFRCQLGCLHSRQPRSDQRRALAHDSDHGPPAATLPASSRRLRYPQCARPSCPPPHR